MRIGWIYNKLVMDQTFRELGPAARLDCINQAVRDVKRDPLFWVLLVILFAGAAVFIIFSQYRSSFIALGFMAIAGSLQMRMVTARVKAIAQNLTASRSESLEQQ